MTLLERLNKFKKIDQNTGCWLWTGQTLPAGYGVMNVQGRKRTVHRVSAHVFLGFDLDSPLQVNHKRTCPHKGCFNPEHLYVGTVEDNMMDYSALKTHCINGHDRSLHGSTKGRSSSGKPIRYCLVCERENSKRYRDAKDN